MEEPPLPFGPALKALGHCVLRAVVLLAQRRIHQPTQHVGSTFRFADGSAAEAYRETVIDRPAPVTPALFVVCFRLRHVHGAWGHKLFRWESILNTVLFVGFPGLVSKVWLRHDQNHLYRGLYEWDEPSLATAYVRALWWVLALVSVPQSIHYAIVPGLSRDEWFRDPTIVDTSEDQEGQWWRLVGVEDHTA